MILDIIVNATSNQESTTSSLKEFLILLIHSAGFINANERITPKLSSKNALKWYIICHMCFLVSETLEYVACIRSLLYVEYIWRVFLLIVVEEGIWKKIIDLYPQLVSCIHSKSEQVLVELQLALIAYSDLLNIPAISIANGTWHVRAGLLSVQRSYRHTRWLCLLLPSIHYNLRVLLTVSSMLNSTFLSPCLTYSGIAEQQITTNWPT